VDKLGRELISNMQMLNMKINLITLINLISKKAPISKLGFGISLGQLEIRIIRNFILSFLLIGLFSG